MAHLNEKPIVLIGMMGAGKSALGKPLATKLSWPFIDLDNEIEKQTGKTIAALFADAGEAAFRSIEEKALLTALAKGRMVLATGGGAILSAASRAALKEKAITIWLKADADTLFARIGKDAGRPLLQKENPKVVLETLLEQRTPFYNMADIHFDTCGARQERVDALVATVQNALAKD